MAYSAPTTKTTGTLITAAIWNQDIVDNQNAAFPLGVDAWTGYTPTLTQSGAVTKTVTYAKYARVGRMVHLAIYLTVTGTGTASNPVKVGLPVNSQSTTEVRIGMGNIYDQSAGIMYGGIVATPSGSVTELVFWPTSTDAANVLGAAVFTAALAANDQVHIVGAYEAAS